MVLWRSASSFTVLLRVSRWPSISVPPPVTPTAPAYSAFHNRPSPYVPRDDGDHDPEIDLITLRRRADSRAISNKTSSDPQKAGQVFKPNDGPPVVGKNQSIDETTSRSAVDLPNSAASKLNSGSHESEAQTDILQEVKTPVDSSGLTMATSNEVTEQPKESKYGSADPCINTLDPYLVQYLKSLQHLPAKSTKRPISLDRRTNQQDLDVDFLRPNDIRSTYGSRKKRTQIRNNKSDVNVIKPTSGVPGIIPDHLIHAGIQHLNLSSSDGKVVIPRTVLLRLIEQTINLSGAAVHGDDVIIERYSPTWHRFARLLRTSDLHRISTLTGPLNSFPSNLEKKNDSEQLEIQDVSHQAAKGKSTTFDRPKTSSNEHYSSSTQTIVEREYVILALDNPKKRVVTTRFRRLLDGSSNVPLLSSESLLKVEYLNKYVSFFKFN